RILLPTAHGHVHEGRRDLHREAAPAQLLGRDDLAAAATEGLVADVAGPRVLADRPGEDLHGFLSGVFVADDPGLALPIDLPDGVHQHRVVAVVLRLAPLDPAHHARLVPEVPEDTSEDRRGLHPDHRLVVEDAELLPDPLDDAAALVRVPAVDGGVRTEN